MDPLYLDNNATTQPAPEVRAAMGEALENLWANPSSVHRFGQAVRQRLELARASVARLLGAKEREIIFTSGGTEANNLALRGTLEAGSAAGDGSPRTLITTPIEHSAVRQPGVALRERGVHLVHLPIDRAGVLSADDLAAALRGHAPRGGLVLVSVQWANNETGVIQPIAELAAAVKAARDEATNQAEARIVFHVDATQAVGKLPVDVTAAGVDLLTLAAHKFHGAKGAGALYARTGVRLRPQQLGGPQERDRRGGTEDTAAIIGMGVAADLAGDFLSDAARIAALAALRDRLENAILAALPDTVVNSAGASSGRLWNTTNLGFPRLEAEAILLGLSERGLCASAGAACSSGSLEPSPVLLAMGIPEEVAHGSVRFSLSRHTTGDEITRAIEIVPAVVRRLAKAMPAG